MAEDRLSVMKFGGSSVGTPDRFRRIGKIVHEVTHKSRVFVVVSALSQVTRELDAAFQKAASGIFPDHSLRAIRQRHYKHAEAVLSREGVTIFTPYLEEIIDHLKDSLEMVRKEGGAPRWRDRVIACGERLAVPLVVHSLEDKGLAAMEGDATDLIKTDENFGSASVRLQESSSRLNKWFADLPRDVIPVMAGFIGSSEKGDTTTLGFEGSDYTAALVASMLGASTLTRWTDVDGVYTSDPRSNPDATRIERISMAEAMKRNEKGKMGMHRKALAPLESSRICVHIRSIDCPDQPGTQIVTE